MSTGITNCQHATLINGSTALVDGNTNPLKIKLNLDTNQAFQPSPDFFARMYYVEGDGIVINDHCLRFQVTYNCFDYMTGMTNIQNYYYVV